MNNRIIFIILVSKVAFDGSQLHHYHQDCTAFPAKRREPDDVETKNNRNTRLDLYFMCSTLSLIMSFYTR